MAETIRLVHCSDIHVTSPKLDWRAADWMSKRLTSWMNLQLRGRGKRFASASDIVARAVDDWRQRSIDHIVFSGDATALGFEEEVQRAAECLRVGEASGLAVPGNHDYLIERAAASGHFERYFSPWLQGRRIGDFPYPFAQQIGPVWLIGVNAATGNCWPWDATGAVDAPQLERLRELLASIPAGAVKILIVHFPICVASGGPETSAHRLRNLAALLDVANTGGVSLWLHGHRHGPYFFQQPAGAAFPVICAGSTTQLGICSHGEYTITQRTLTAVRRVYDPEGQSFRDVETFKLDLKR
jgi:3',5'-cyclic AMP phosphodiesterase CpdA